MQCKSSVRKVAQKVSRWLLAVLSRIVLRVCTANGDGNSSLQEDTLLSHVVAKRSSESADATHFGAANSL